MKSKQQEQVIVCASTLCHEEQRCALSLQHPCIKEGLNTEGVRWLMSEYVGNIYVSDIDTYELLYLNDTACRALHEKPENLLGRLCYEVIQGRTSVCPFCTNAYLKEGEVYEWEFENPVLKRTFMNKDRLIEWDGRLARMELSHDMYSTAYQLAKKDRERDAIIRMIPGGFARVDAKDMQTILWYGGGFLELIGYTKEQFETELDAKRGYLHPEDAKRAVDIMEHARRTGKDPVMEGRIITRDGKVKVLMMTYSYVSAENSWDGIPSFYCLGLDTTEEKNKLKKLQHRAEKDELTGIYNRAETEHLIKRYLSEHAHEQAALIMVDTDNFKQINDSYGHLVGDIVLTAMASSMKKLMKDSDIVGRIGGDEFTIFMKHTSLDEVERTVKQLLPMFQQLFEKEKNPINVTCSIGIACYPEHGETFQELYACADRALYRAKIHGKNHYEIYHAEIEQELEKTKYSMLGAAIDSELRESEDGDNLARYIFRILYEHKDFDQAVNIILGVIGKQFDVSRVYIFESEENYQFCSNTYEWCQDGILAQMDQLQHINYHDVGDYEQLFDDDLMFYCQDIHRLKPVWKELFDQQGISSVLQYAYLEKASLGGFIGFDECTGTRFWTQKEKELLKLIAQILFTFLRQRKLEKLLQ